MRVLAVIPARFGASRLPGKPLLDLEGVPVVVRVWERARKARQISDLVVATDDNRVVEVIERAGGQAVMTRRDHPSGSDRVWEVLEHHDAEAVINVQGDEPFLDPDILDGLVLELIHGRAPVVTVATRLVGDPWEPSRVKVSLDDQGMARDFSRLPLGEGPQWQHIGLYGFRRAALRSFVSMPPSPRERAEHLEQLRLIEAGVRIRVLTVDHCGLSIDTLEDLERARERLRTTSDRLPG
jgi:3-deoxy-manno-octulosonate cytidylyltransferase (CMP-KDO synthetase)